MTVMLEAGRALAAAHKCKIEPLPLLSNFFHPARMVYKTRCPSVLFLHVGLLLDNTQTNKASPVPGWVKLLLLYPDPGCP